MNFEQTETLFSALDGNSCSVQEVLTMLPIEVQRAGYDEAYLQQHYDEAHSDLFLCSLIPVMDWFNEVDAEKMQDLMFSYEMLDDLWVELQRKMNLERNKNLR